MQSGTHFGKDSALRAWGLAKITSGGKNAKKWVIVAPSSTTGAAKPPVFAQPVGESENSRITKNRRCQVERDAVFVKIGESLRLIPFELALVFIQADFLLPCTRPCDGRVLFRRFKR